MIVAGCDVGSLTAKAVILSDDKLLAGQIMPVSATVEDSAQKVMGAALEAAGMGFSDLARVLCTGYGRFSVSFARENVSEISCHGMGAHFVNPDVRTVIDIGGQDCKVVCIDSEGYVTDFLMNDKCAAGTGRSLEILSAAIGLSLEELGPVSLSAKNPLAVNNRCSIFMEQEVLKHLYRKKRKPDIAAGINDAVARRVAALARSVTVKEKVALTGGVSKNPGVAARLSQLLGVSFATLPVDAQLMGALGAAVFARTGKLPSAGGN
ncbi:MAG: acyl-CoA dehydratase activase [Thermodesulfobacteriota bacterium]